MSTSESDRYISDLGRGALTIADTMELILGRGRGLALRAGAMEGDHGVVMTSFYGQDVYVIWGADGQQYVLEHTNDEEFLMWYAVIEHMFGGNVDDGSHGGMFFLTGDEWKFQRQILNKALDPNHISRYLLLVQDSIHRLTEFREGREYSFYHRAQLVAFTNSIVAFLGLDADDKRIPGLLREWKRFALGVLDLSGSGLLGYSHYARFKINRLLHRVIRDRRRQPGGDFVTEYVTAQRTDGTGMSDRGIIEALRFIIYAGFDTTANSMSWAVQEFLDPKNREFHDQILDEVQAFKASSGSVAYLGVDQLRHFPAMARFIDEVLRLHSQVHILPRRIGDKSIRIYGHEIPAHSYVLLLPAITHTLPALYPDPDTFNPARHIGTATDVRYARVPFGGGARMCPGRNLATLEITAMLIHLANMELEGKGVELVPDQDLSGVQRPLHRPRGKVMVRRQINSSQGIH